MPSESINYDRAADFYDVTRAYPEGIAEEIAAFIAKKAFLKADKLRWIIDEWSLQELHLSSYASNHKLVIT